MSKYRLVVLLLVCSAFVLTACDDDSDIEGLDSVATADDSDSSDADNDNDTDGDTEMPDANRSVPPVTDPYADNGTVLNILPPGQDDNGGVTNLFRSVPGLQGLLSAIIDDGVGPTGLVPALTREPHFNDQLGMYEDLVFSEPGLSNDQLTQYFKPETIRGPDQGPWEDETEVSDDQFAAEIKRDDFGVPHIFGDTREDAEFGAGYATAQDRLFLLDVLRRAGRGELSKFLGPADFSFDRDIAEGAPYRELDRTAQINRLPDKFGETGTQVIQDTRAFIAGLNAYVRDARRGLLAVPVEYLALGVQLEEFKDEDVHAIATLIQSIFAGGGGQEQNNVRLINALRGMGQSGEQSCELWRDLRNAYDVESTVTTPESFATQSPRVLDDEVCPFSDGFASEYPGAAVFDAGSYEDYSDFTTEPCGRPGQVSCPQALGNVPALPGLGVIGGALENVIDLLDTLTSLSYNDDPQRSGDQARHASVMVATGPESWLAQGRDMILEGYRDVLGSLTEAARWGLARLGGGDMGYDYAARGDDALKAAQQRIQSIGGMFQNLSDGLPTAMSNALLVSADHTASGHPVAVFGPQTSYFEPQLLVEMAVNGGDIHTRGMTFAGLPYVVIGRGPDFAWSATSGSSDLTDVRAVRTCSAAEPADNSDPAIEGRPTGYMTDGVCKPFDFIRENWPARWNLAVPVDGIGSVGQNFRVERNIIRTQEYGPVFAFASVDGQPIALTRQRSTYGGELDTVLPFFLATRNDVFDAQSFLEVFNTTTGSFNWFYADDSDIAYIHAGLYPKRAEGTHPDLPSWGNGQYDWQGFLEIDRHPQAINPERGYLASWNNRPARDWWASDAQAGYGSVYRNDALEIRLRDLIATGGITRANMVEAMEDAGTVDLRGQEVLPAALDIIERGELTDDQNAAVTLMRNWSGADLSHRAMRRDRDDSGDYDDESAVALMDTWYDPMIEATLPQLVALENVDGENLSLIGRDNPPGPMGSAYQGGYYGYLRRVFDISLDRAGEQYKQLRCADSDQIEDCRQALLASLDTAVESLGGIENMASWEVDESEDAIQHRALGLSQVRPIEWVNRPTFQQVVEFERGR